MPRSHPSRVRTLRTLPPPDFLVHSPDNAVFLRVPVEEHVSDVEFSSHGQSLLSNLENYYTIKLQSRLEGCYTNNSHPEHNEEQAGQVSDRVGWLSLRVL